MKGTPINILHGLNEAIYRIYFIKLEPSLRKAPVIDTSTIGGGRMYSFKVP